jgi:hypothetical protein
MPDASDSAGVHFRELGSGTSRYEVLHQDRTVGTVARFVMGAGQFGSSWTATTPAGQTSRFSTREDAAAWLVRQASA